MNLTNYHSHCSYCDGKAPLEDFIIEAIKQGFTSYGISSHAPLPFATNWTMKKESVGAYLEECRRMKEKYASELEIYIGMEIDYLDEENNPANTFFRQLPLDYRIGSVHLLRDKAGNVVDIDCSPDKFVKKVTDHFDGDIQNVVKLYFDKLLRMVETGGFDIVGHADKMHYNASCHIPGLLDQEWYNSIIRNYFEAIARKGYMVEVNTKAFHRYGTFFPNERYFSLLKELGIPVLVNSDAHYPEKINDGRYEALSALKKAGITEVMELHSGKWIPENIH